MRRLPRALGAYAFEDARASVRFDGSGTWSGSYTSATAGRWWVRFELVGEVHGGAAGFSTATARTGVATAAKNRAKEQQSFELVLRCAGHEVKRAFGIGAVEARLPHPVSRVEFVVKCQSC